MSQNINTHCAICGKGYHLCLSCNKDNSAEWKKHTDTAEHYKIFQILKGNFLGIYTDKEANEKLSNVDLSDMKDFNSEVKAAIKKIQKSQVEQSANEVSKSNGFFKKDKKSTDTTPNIKDVAGVVTEIKVEKK